MAEPGRTAELTGRWQDRIVTAATLNQHVREVSKRLVREFGKPSGGVVLDPEPLQHPTATVTIGGVEFHAFGPIEIDYQDAVPPDVLANAFTQRAANVTSKFLTLQGVLDVLGLGAPTEADSATWLAELEKAAQHQQEHDARLRELFGDDCPVLPSGYTLAEMREIAANAARSRKCKRCGFLVEQDKATWARADGEPEHLCEVCRENEDEKLASWGPEPLERALRRLEEKAK